jgi:hypothetical protein
LIKRFVKAREGVALRDLAEQDTGSLKAKNEMAFLEAVFSSQGILSEELSSRFTNGAYLLRKWLGKGILETYQASVVRDPAGNVLLPYPAPKELYAQQRGALEHIKATGARNLFGFSPPRGYRERENGSLLPGYPSCDGPRPAGHFACS